MTNQAGIGRGYYSEADFHVLMDWLKARFIEKGGQIDAIYFCPYHPEYGIGQYRRASDCRKPAPGMLLQAQRDLDIDMAKSILIGDKPSDMAAGQAARVNTLLHLGGPAVDKGCLPLQRLADALPYLVS